MYSIEFRFEYEIFLKMFLFSIILATRPTTPASSLAPTSEPIVGKDKKLFRLIQEYTLKNSCCLYQ